MKVLRSVVNDESTKLTDIVASIPGVVYQYVIRPGNKSGFSFLSEGLNDLFGVMPEEVYKDIKVFSACIHPDDKWSVYEALKKTRSGTLRFRIITPTGKQKLVQGSAKTEILKDGGIVWNGVLIERFDDRKAEADLERLSTHDQLTGIYNRAYFESELARLGSANNTAIGVFDIDGLKIINDTFGHAEGDRLLIIAANIIRTSLRPGDIVARTGGDEFAALLPGVGEQKAEEISRAIKESIVNQVVDNFHVPFSVSVGFSIGGPMTKTLADVYKTAEDIMYREKLHHAGSMRSKIVQALGMALEARDYVTDGHASRLQAMALMLATASGLPDNRFGDLRLLARFHDIGKVAIPDEILFKPGPLNEQETVTMRKHSEIGHRMALTLPDLAPIADWILKHHEWWDGSGYPLKIRGEEIPLECRIISIVDAYDSMVNDRPYRLALTHRAAIHELRRNSGIQFDSFLVDRFVNLLEGQYSS